MRKVLIICGPTATGKTKLALALAKKFNGELVSADSRQVYKGLDILTGKDLPVDDIPLWLYDVALPSEPFSVAQYQRLARAVIDDIHRRGKLPILVGGTGLYIRAVVQPIDTASVPQNLSLRKKLHKAAVPQLQKTLMLLDPEKWDQMNHSDSRNPRRLVRAIEVATWNKSHKRAEAQRAPSYGALWIALTGSRELLKENIENRVRARFSQGVMDEVEKLGDTAGDRSLPAATSLGLVFVRRHIAGEISLEKTIKQWTAQEYDYAKRQLTWFRKEKDISWFDISNADFQKQVEALVGKWYTL